MSLEILADFLKKHSSLEAIIKNFAEQYKLVPCFGAELEFYLSPNIDVVEFSNLLSVSVKPEKGYNQFEIDFAPTDDLPVLISCISNTRTNMKVIASRLGGTVDFKAKPFVDDYGSSMHIHVNFLNNSDKNLIEHAAKSLCHYMLPSFLLFAPDDNDYLRFNKEYMAPTHVCYGGNNRTVAVRIPDAYPFRLEHRIAGASADPELVSFAILKSIQLGLQQPEVIGNFIRIHGNAFDPQYNLTPLPAGKKEAERLFWDGRVLSLSLTF